MTSNNSYKKQLLLGISICIIGALFYCYEFVLRIVPGILQTELSEAFGNISATTFGQISALYYFAYSPMQLPVGILMDRYGAKKLLTLACLSCTIGSLMFSYPSSLLVAGTGRFLIGFGSAFAFVGVLSSAVNWLPYKYFSLIAGLMTTIGMLGLVYGEIKITALAHSYSLESILSMLVIIGLIMTIAIFLIVKDKPRDENKDIVPLAKFLKSVAKVLKTPEIWLIGFIGASLYTSLSIFGELWGKSYLECAHHLTKSQAAKTISIMFVGWAIGAPLAGFVSDRFISRTNTLIVGAIFSLIFICLILYVPNLSHSALNILMLMYGIFSATEIIVFAMANEYIKKAMPGTAFAIINMIVTLAGVIFQPLVGTILDLSSDGKVDGNVHIYAIQDYQMSLSILPILLFLTMACLFLIRSKIQTSSTE